MYSGYVLSVSSGKASEPLSCSIAGTLEIIGDRWTILTLRDAFRGIRRFEHFHDDLGVARNLLSDRLAKLVSHGILEKVLYEERPPRYEYRLTPKGRDLSPALVALLQWGDRHLAGPAGPPIELVHAACGEPLDQVFVCWRCDTTATPSEIRSRPLRPAGAGRAPRRSARPTP
jgi:DNA-binding HxlR family transcriptional regulator